MLTPRSVNASLVNSSFIAPVLLNTLAERGARDQPPEIICSTQGMPQVFGHDHRDSDWR